MRPNRQTGIRRRAKRQFFTHNKNLKCAPDNVNPRPTKPCVNQFRMVRSSTSNCQVVQRVCAEKRPKQGRRPSGATWTDSVATTRTSFFCQASCDRDHNVFTVSVRYSWNCVYLS